MFGVLREYQAPTGVTHAARGRFGLAHGSWGVVFARKTSVELYVVRANANTARLELIQTTPIGATIVSLSVLRRTTAAGDILWLGFDDMRLVALTWDVNSRAWVQEQKLSLGSLLGHNLCNPPDVMIGLDPEDPGRKLLRGKTGADAHPIIRSDPSGRCIAVLAVEEDVLYIVPNVASEDMVGTGGVVNPDDIFIIDLKSSYNACNVKDIVFLQGTFEPNIVVLFEPKRTWSGRAAVQRLTSQLLAVSIDVRSKRHSKTWVMDKLSYDCFRVEAIPESAEGGVLVLAPNVIMQVRHGACVAGLSLNCFGDAYATESRGTYDAIAKSDNLMSLDAGHCRFLDWEEPGLTGPSQSTVLLSLKGGELYFLSLSFGSSNSLQMQRAGSTVLASEIVPINDRFFVLASRLSDSLLVEYQKTAEEPTANALGTSSEKATSDENSTTGGQLNVKKRPRASEDDDAEFDLYGTKLSNDDEEADEKNKTAKPETIELDEQDEATRGVYDDEDELGWVFSKSMEDEKASKESIKAGKWALKVKDTLPCFGPGTDLTVGLNPNSPQGDVLDMVVAGGYAKNGCLAVVHQTVRAKDNFHLNLPDCTGCWTIRDPSFSRREMAARDARNRATSRRNETCRARNAKKQAARKIFVDEILAKYRRAQIKVLAESKTTEKGEKAERKEPTSPSDAPTEEGSKSFPLAVSASKEESVPVASSSKATLPEEQTEGKRTSKRIKIEPGADMNAQAIPGKDDSSIMPEDIVIPSEIMEQAEADANAEERFQPTPEERLEEVLDGEEDLYAHILLSTLANTVVLSTGVELKEIDGKTIGLITDEPTISAANMFNNRLYVQVTKSRVRVLKDNKVQCEHILETGSSRIKSAQLLDPQALIVTEDGIATVLTVTAEEFTEASTATKDQSVKDEDLVVDEYGIVLNPSKNAENHEKNGGTEKSGANGVPELLRSLKNISICVDFKSASPSSSSNAISCACLYHGPLAMKAVLDGTANSSAKETDAASSKAVTSLDKPDTVDAEGPEVSPKEDVKVIEDVDEEDRMLYGDDDDEEDLMLYGDSKDEPVLLKTEPTLLPAGKAVEGEPAAAGNGDKPPIPVETRTLEKGVLYLSETRAANTNNSKTLLGMVTRSGSLEIRAQELDFAIILECNHFFTAPTAIFDSAAVLDEKLKKKLRSPRKHRIQTIAMTEVLASAAVPGMSTPMLVAVSESGLPLIYTMYMGQGKSLNRARSKLRMRRYVAADRVSSLFARSVAATQALTKPVNAADKATINFSISQFENVDGRAGLFVSGPSPFFIFVERGYPRVHALYHKNPMTLLNRGVLSFSELHYIGSGEQKARAIAGFVSVADKGVIRLGELPDPGTISLDCPSPMRKIALRCTPHKVAYHAGSATYGVLASMPTLTTREERLNRILQSLEKHDKRHYQHTVAQAEAESGDGKVNRVPPLFEELHELRVYIAESWELKMSFKLEKGEVGLAIANMKVDVFKQRLASSGDIPSSHRGEDGNESLFAASAKKRPKDMLVVGTGYVNGEDATSRGRLLLFEVSRSESVSAQGTRFKQFQLFLIAQKQLSSPVTAVASMEGYVICGVGPQVSVYKLVGDEIVHLSFAFGQLFCTSISSLKQYVVTGDMRKSVSFMYFRERNSSVNFLGKDFEHVTSHATEFLVRNDDVSIIMSDGSGNIHALRYAHASVPESRGGKRLLVNGGVSYGSQINKFVRVRDSQGADIAFRNSVGGAAGRHALAFTTVDGAIGMVVSADERQFETMRSLARCMEDSPLAPRYSGIHPADVNRFNPESSSTELLAERLCDSRTAFEFFGLSTAAATKVARELGTDMGSISRVVADLDGVLASFG